MLPIANSQMETSIAGSSMEVMSPTTNSEPELLNLRNIDESVKTLMTLFSTTKALILKLSTSCASSSTNNCTVDFQNLHNQMTKWELDLKFITRAIDNLQDLVDKVGNQLDSIRLQGELLNHKMNNSMQNRFEMSAQRAKEIQSDAFRVTEMLMKLKHQIPYPPKINLDGDSELVKVVRDVDDLLEVLLNLEDYRSFRKADLDLSYFDKTFKDSINGGLILLEFSLFPEGTVVSKSMLSHFYYYGKRIVWVFDILREFTKQGYIEPVFENGRFKGFRMHALIRFCVIFKAEKLGLFRFDSTWNPTGDISYNGIAVLVENAFENSQGVGISSNPEKLKRLLNINSTSLELKRKWCLRMKNVEVIQLGCNRHIELLNVNEFLSNMKNMKHLMVLSLQGISGVEMLPKCVSKLTNLVCLDLNACHDLKELPNWIGSLRNLEILDVSECDLLDGLPNEIKLLVRLRVLKGFVIKGKQKKDSASIFDLSEMKQLRKLSVSTYRGDFPTYDELKVLAATEYLKKLNIIWKSGPTNDVDEPRKRWSSTVLKRLQKLDLQQFPHTKPPYWLNSTTLKSLKKLYIEGGNLQYLQLDEIWKVKVLRFTNLPKFEHHWGQLKNAFPDLVYLEKVNCPSLTGIPCNDDGVWFRRGYSLDYALGFNWNLKSKTLD